MVQHFCIYPVNSVFSLWLPPQNTLLSSSRLFIWEILHSTIRKMDKHVQKIQQELEEAKDKLEKQQHKRVTSSSTSCSLQLIKGIPLRHKFSWFKNEAKH